MFHNLMILPEPKLEFRATQGPVIADTQYLSLNKPNYEVPSCLCENNGSC
jgi:hypothetical protein